MDDDKFTLLNEIEDQNYDNGNSEPQQSRHQVYQPPNKSQEYQTPAPQYYQPPQPQLYQPPQPQSQENLTPQAQNLPQPLYQTSENQNLQPQSQSQDQSHYLVQNEYNTPYQNPLNKPLDNSMYRGESNQTQIQEMSSNPVINNNEIFTEPNKDLNNRRITIRIILIFLLLISIPMKIINYILFVYRNEGWAFLSIIITDIPILIVGIWMIINIRRKIEKNSNFVPTSLSAFILNIMFGFPLDNEFIIFAYIYRLIILLIIVIYNIKCKCRD